MELENMRIADFYKDRSIFITGSTGFMGKILVEKLLSACPDVHKIYLLMRPLSGRDVQSRLQVLIDNQVLDYHFITRPITFLTSKLQLFDPIFTLNNRSFHSFAVNTNISSSKTYFLTTFQLTNQLSDYFRAKKTSFLIKFELKEIFLIQFELNNQLSD